MILGEAILLLAETEPTVTMHASRIAQSIRTILPNPSAAYACPPAITGFSHVPFIPSPGNSRRR